jgi:HAE1 family hydrophobic/amphiphilic exporter-1
MDITAAILMIDMIVSFRDSGMPRDQAVVEGAAQRLRPILMTVLISIIVMVPVAFWPKTGMDAYSSLGTVVIGGLTIGTVLTLVVIPVLHTLVDDLAVWTNRSLRGHRHAGDPGWMNRTLRGRRPTVRDSGA